MLLGLWVAIGALVASAPGVQAEEGRALRVTDDTETGAAWKFHGSMVQVRHG